MRAEGSEVTARRGTPRRACETRPRCCVIGHCDSSPSSWSPAIDRGGWAIRSACSAVARAEGPIQRGGRGHDVLRRPAVCSLVPGRVRAVTASVVAVAPTRRRERRLPRCTRTPAELLTACGSGFRTLTPSICQSSAVSGRRARMGRGAGPDLRRVTRIHMNRRLARWRPATLRTTPLPRAFARVSDNRGDARQPRLRNPFRSQSPTKECCDDREVAEPSRTP